MQLIYPSMADAANCGIFLPIVELDVVSFKLESFTIVTENPR
jgi:hypothetical protein